MGLEPETEYKINATCFSDIAESEPTESITVKTTELPKITKINVPQRLDLYVGETKQLDVSTVPVESMRAYEHVNKAVLDNSIVKFDGDNVSGVKSVNDDRLGRNLLQNSEQTSFIKNGEYLLEKELNVRVEEWNCSNAVLYKAFKAEKSFIGVIQDAKNNQIKKGERCILSVYVKNLGDSDLSFTFFSKEYTVLSGESNRVTIVDRLTTEKGYLQLAISIKNAEEVSNASFILWRGKFEITDRESVSPWTPAPEDGYSYTNANVTFNDDEKSSAEFDIYVHERKRMTSLTESDTASFIL